MPYTKLTPALPFRDEALDYDDIGPGLYFDEMALVLDDGTKVAVSVKETWQENGGGVEFIAWARAIEDDGSTKQATEGQHIETVFSFHADAAKVARHGKATLAREMLLLVIGELPGTEPIDDGDGGTTNVPIIPVSDDARISVSIRQALHAASGAIQDPASLLGI